MYQTSPKLHLTLSMCLASLIIMSIQMNSLDSSSETATCRLFICCCGNSKSQGINRPLSYGNRGKLSEPGARVLTAANRKVVIVVIRIAEINKELKSTTDEFMRLPEDY
jgi:hypothetical protein